MRETSIIGEGTRKKTSMKEVQLLRKETHQRGKLKTIKQGSE